MIYQRSPLFSCLKYAKLNFVEDEMEINLILMFFEGSFCPRLIADRGGKKTWCVFTREDVNCARERGKSGWALLTRLARHLGASAVKVRVPFYV